MDSRTEQRCARRAGRRQLLLILATAIPVWNFYGFAIDFFRDTWGDASIPVLPISYGLNASFVVLLPLLAREGRRELRAAVVLGAAMALWSAVGMAFSPAAKLVYTTVPTTLGAATAAVALSRLRRRSGVDQVVPSGATIA